MRNKCAYQRRNFERFKDMPTILLCILHPIGKVQGILQIAGWYKPWMSPLSAFLRDPIRNLNPALLEFAVY